MDDMKVSRHGPGSRSGLGKRVLKKNWFKLCLLGGFLIAGVCVLYKFHAIDQHQSDTSQRLSDTSQHLSDTSQRLSDTNQKLSDTVQRLSKDEEKYDSAISEIKNDVNFLKKQNTREEDAIKNMQKYALELQANLTELRGEFEKSLLELQEGNKTDSHLMSLIEYHSNQNKLLNDTLNQVGALTSEKSDEIRRQLITLREENRNLTMQLHQNGDSDLKFRNSIQHQQQDLKGSVNAVHRNLDALSKKTKEPVHLFDQCQFEDNTCKIGSRGNGRYWKACPTEFFPIKKMGYTAMGYWCSYQSSSMEYSENLNLFEKNDKIRCDCDVTFPGENSAEHREVGSLDATCTLHILRCPTSVTLFH